MVAEGKEMTQHFISNVEMIKQNMKMILGDKYDEETANRYANCMKFLDDDIEKDFPSKAIKNDPAD
jgi:hypothetical protein